MDSESNMVVSKPELSKEAIAARLTKYFNFILGESCFQDTCNINMALKPALFPKFGENLMVIRESGHIQDKCREIEREAASHVSPEIL